MSQGIVLRRARRRPRAALLVPLMSLTILVLGWSVLWAVARAQASAGLDGFIASEAAHGRLWSCPDRTVDGYPFRIQVACRGVAFAGTVDGSPGEGHLAGLMARAWLYEPSAVYLLLDGPMTLSTADHHADLAIGWDRLGAKLRGVFGGRPRAEVVGEGLTLSRPGGAGVFGGTARRVALRAGPAAVAPGSAAVPDADAAEGGRVEVSEAALTKGPLALGAAGSLGLDALHRLEGRLDARLGGFGPVLKRYGISLGAVQVGGLLANLLGGRPAAAPPPTAPPGAVSLPVAFADGTVAVGPFKTGLRLPPLY